MILLKGTKCHSLSKKMSKYQFYIPIKSVGDSRKMQLLKLTCPSVHMCRTFQRLTHADRIYGKQNVWIFSRLEDEGESAETVSQEMTLNQSEASIEDSWSLSTNERLVSSLSVKWCKNNINFCYGLSLFIIQTVPFPLPARCSPRQKTQCQENEKCQKNILPLLRFSNISPIFSGTTFVLL